MTKWLVKDTGNDYWMSDKNPRKHHDYSVNNMKEF